MGTKVKARPRVRAMVRANKTKMETVTLAKGQRFHRADERMARGTVTTRVKN